MAESHGPPRYLSITGQPLDLGIDGGFLGNCSSISSFERLNAAGEGTYGIVSRARDKRNGAIVALKQVRILDEERHYGIPITAMREISILRSLKHPNVINVLDVAVDDMVLEDVHMVMEFCEQDLARLIDVYKMEFTLAEVKCIAKQLLEGLEYLHRSSIIHRDVKLENLLLTRDGTLKIADFGLAREYAARPMSPCVVTIWYRAPELLLGTENYTPSVDLWSTGLIIGELILGTAVLPGNSSVYQLSLIVKLLGSPLPEDIQAFSAMGCPNLIKWETEHMPHGRVDNLERKFVDATWDTMLFLSGLLQWNPGARWTATEALGKSKSEIAADAEAWWKKSPGAADKASFAASVDRKIKHVDDGDATRRQSSEEGEGAKRKLEENNDDYGGYVFDFGEGEPATKLPPRKRRSLRR
ncbi:uncharacterized protein K452DRAFT_256016 [Aplosporella prunicola CBS 121167]|uniref:cyclin-dependent kinase n=1 Tax=Aplosporella prunicola CBS 121167 TaxID=1176127 RepID=A0A6A6B361_9PEZI|nr:uncharacterized protein K452DRAFT_256016 [Aplosporella prunicola CBS 121167]KAF2138490.1 hypothetical protein K452DRAFT_256016 [Aplosporella prunicola CBS 121167]